MSSRRPIIHVTTVHARDDIRVFRKECRSLAKAFPNRVVLYVADGKGNDIVEGVQIKDLGNYRRQRLKRMLLASTLARQIEFANPVVVHIHDPELLPAALVLARNGVKVLYDAHEDLPRSIYSKHWIPESLRGVVARPVGFFESFVTRRLAGVVAATPHIAARFRRVNPNTIEASNYPLLEELSAPIPASARDRQVCYIGGISKARGIKPVVEALALVPEISLSLCGSFTEEPFLRELQELPGWKQVTYHGEVSRAQAQRLARECMAGIVTFLPEPNHVNAQPNKVFEYMQAGLPVIASAFPLWRDLIELNSCGICVDPESPEQIAHAIRVLMNDEPLRTAMGIAGRGAVLTKYNWKTEEQKLKAFYDAILAADPKRRPHEGE